MFKKIYEIKNLYFSKKLIFIFLMGVVSGIPLYLILSTLMIWLSRENINIATIGLFSLTQLPWSLKFLWAPLIDSLKIPIFGKLLGNRRSWLVFTQFFLGCSIILLGINDPNKSLFFCALLAVIVAFFSATQDIIIDAYRIEILKDFEQGAGAAMTQAGYRIGGIIAGAGALYFKEIVEWKIVFLSLGILIFIFMFLNFYAPEEHKYQSKKNKKEKYEFHIIFTKPIKEFFLRSQKLYLIIILLFILFFKLGDVVAGVMANPFYVKIGFTNIEIANASKLFGVIATLVGVFVGGYLIKIYGILYILIIGSILQIISNLLFVFLSIIGPEFVYLILTVAGENFSGGLGSAAFVAYISILCNKEYTATQYALLSSIMGIARTILSSPSGYMVSSLGWTYFFLISTIFGIPGLLILIWMKKKFPLEDQISKS
tara:strand:- start:469 stop:1755 length:1287 start_codon:yes stop_codon:yes gene_type:complete